MKKFLYNIILYSVIFALVYVLVAGLFSRNWNYYRIGSYGHMYSRVKEIKDYYAPDILFLGSSHSYRSFDTRVFLEYGKKTFNLGSSLQTPKQTEALLKKYLDIINPRFIVFEVYPMPFQSDGIESTTDLISNDHIDYEICKLAISSGSVKVINTLIYGLFQEYVFNIRDSFQEKAYKSVFNGEDFYVSGGFVEKVEHDPFVGDDTVRPVTLHPRSDQIKAFEHCIKMIRDRSIPYILVKAPLPEKTSQSITNQDEFNEIISSYGTYIDFNTILHLDDSCFFDSDHLAQPGVRLFDDCLIRVLDTIDLKGCE